MRAAMLATVLSVLFWASPLFAVEVEILWLERRLPPTPVLSNLDPVPEDLGLQGAAQCVPLILAARFLLLFLEVLAQIRVH